jgi:hypothetical protein
MITYESYGGVRGGCGHHHRTIGAALRCGDKDGRACASLGGGAYSDRRTVRRTDREDLTREEDLQLLRDQLDIIGYNRLVEEGEL